MAKLKTVYVCTQCGAESPKWIGKCPSCGEWNSYVEEVISSKSSTTQSPSYSTDSPRSKPQKLEEISISQEERIDLHDTELNRVLGGGLVPGSMVLIGGEPGIGKSTLVLQTVLGLTGKKVLMYREKKVPAN